MKIPNLLFYGKIQEGKLQIFNRKMFLDAINKSENTAIVLEIKQDRKKRSLDQNAYYWGVVLATISLETGHTTDDLHKICKEMFAPKKSLSFKKNKTDTVEMTITIGKDSKELNTSEFSEYIERIRAYFGSEFGIMIPDPTKGYDENAAIDELYKDDDFDPSLIKI